MSLQALPRSLFVECCLKHGKRLRRMSHPAGSVDPRGNAEGHVARIRLGWIGASALEQLLQSFMPRSREFGKTQPGESSCAIDQRHTIGDRSDRCIRLQPDNRLSTFVSLQPAFSASAHANIPARPAPQNPSDQTAVVSLGPGCGGDRSRRRRSPAVAPIALQPVR